MDDSRFDSFTMAITTRLASRRMVGKGAFAVVLAGVPAFDRLIVDAAKGRRKYGGNKGQERRKKPRIPDRPTLRAESDDCGTSWPGKGKKQRRERKYCRFIRRQCDGDDPREFCIRSGTKPDGKPTKVAVCCAAGETCCGGECCPTDDPYHACCDGRCVDTGGAADHCGACGNRCAATNETCVLGQCSCVDDCDDDCPFGQTLCGDACVDTKTHPDHCGGCFHQNVNGLKCCNGNLCHYINGVCCGSTCYPQGWPSC